MATTAPPRTSTRPLPYQDGNWVCQDPGCGNVNYPRRTECNKCKTPRGPEGDALVEAFMAQKSGKRPREDHVTGPPQQFQEYHDPYAPQPMYAPAPVSYVAPGAYVAGPQYSLLPPHAQPGQAAPGPVIQMAAPQGSRDPSAEGKRIAEHLLSLFGSSEDAFRDASDCLASATLWLHSLKPPATDPGYATPNNGHGAGSGGPSDQSPGQGQGQGMGQGMGSAPGGRGVPQPYGLMPAGQPLHYSPMPQMVGMPGVHQVGTPGGQTVVYQGAIAGGVPLPPGAMMVPAPMHHPGPSPDSAKQFRSTRPPGVRFEDYAHRPSDYLKEFGDPAVSMAAGSRPTVGMNGNWPCEKCNNVNYPRRTHCKTCNEIRGPKGDAIVKDYVRHLLDG